MNEPQIIKPEGMPGYVLIPAAVYQRLRGEIERELAGLNQADGDSDSLPFRPEDYVSNPVALARIKARLTQAELAERMGVSQAYVSKIEGQPKVSAKVLEKVQRALLPASNKRRRAYGSVHK